LKNHQRYATKHRYPYRSVVANTPKDLDRYLHGRNGGWGKISLIQEIFNEANPPEYVFWMDADSLFINDSISLEDLTIPSKDFVISGDMGGINTGHFLMKNTEWSRELLRSAWKFCPPPAFQFEQAGIMAILGGADAENQHTWVTSMEKCRGRCVSSKEANSMMQSLPTDSQEHLTFLPQCMLNENNPRSLSKNTFIWHMAGGSPLAVKSATIENVADHIEHMMLSIQNAWATITHGRLQTQFEMPIHPC